MLSAEGKRIELDSSCQVKFRFGARKLMCGKWVSLLQHRKLTRARAPKFNKQVVSDERKRRRAGSNKQGKTRCSGTPVSKSTCEMQRRSSIGQLQFCPHPRGVQLPFHFLLCCKLWRLTVTNRICPPLHIIPPPLPALFMFRIASTQLVEHSPIPATISSFFA